MLNRLNLRVALAGSKDQFETCRVVDQELCPVRAHLTIPRATQVSWESEPDICYSV